MSKSMRYRAVIGSGLLLLALLTFSYSDVRLDSAALPQGAVCRVRSEQALIPRHEEMRSIQSGRHSAINQDNGHPVFSTLVQSLDAPWLQVNFGDSNLGRNSFLRLTALSNGDVQELNVETLAAWHNRSAMFKGDTIKIELVAAPDDQDVFFEVKSVIVGDWVGGVPLRSSRPTVAQLPAADSRHLDVTHYNPDSVCGADDRVAASDPAIGRTSNGCTGWVISNGAFLTAGHCNDGRLNQIQFNVPASNADGTINPPPIKDQYPIDTTSIMSANNGEGDDWAVFRVTKNISTSLTPPLAYGKFYRVKPNDDPATVRVTGYGKDGPAPCYGDSRQSGCTIPEPTPVPLNSANQTEQTATGPGQGRSGTHVMYSVDTVGGNSGSPVSYPDQAIAVAIHTHGTIDAACNALFNGGTAFTNVALANAINNFPGTAVRYVDGGYPAWTTEDGTVFRPFNLLAEGINSITSGGIVSVVAAHYNEPMTINKNIILEAPVGTVVIGAP